MRLTIGTLRAAFEPAEGVAEDTAAKRGGWSEGKAFPLVKFEGEFAEFFI